MQPSRRKCSGLANGSSRVGGCFAMLAALEAGASAVAGLVFCCQSRKVKAGTFVFV